MVNTPANKVFGYMGSQWAIYNATVVNEFEAQFTSQNGFSSLDVSSRSWS